MGEHADFDGIERLALVTGGEIVSTFGKPELVKIGKCDLIEQVSIGDETLLKFSGVPLGEACSVVLRGATEQIIGEAERSLHDALCVLTSTVKEPRTLYGGGCSELLMARAVDELASVTPGKEARAMSSFANALRQLPSIIAENGGYDSAQLVSELKAKHILGESTMGLNMTEGQVGCMQPQGRENKIEATAKQLLEPLCPCILLDTRVTHFMLRCSQELLGVSCSCILLVTWITHFMSRCPQELPVFGLLKALL